MGKNVLNEVADEGVYRSDHTGDLISLTVTANWIDHTYKCQEDEA
jgi:hypothetical protein